VLEVRRTPHAAPCTAALVNVFMAALPPASGSEYLLSRPRRYVTHLWYIPVQDNPYTIARMESYVETLWRFPRIATRRTFSLL
jgi:hypothetical protein